MAPRMPHVSEANGSSQRILTLRHGDQVNVIGHQAIGPDGGAIAIGMIAQGLQIFAPVAVIEEHCLASVATMRHVIRHTGNGNAPIGP